MMLRRIFLALAASLAGMSPAAANFDRVPKVIEWTIAPGGEDTGEPRLTLRTRNDEGATALSTNQFTVAHMEGLDRTALASAGSSVTFRLVREAGTLACEGVAGRQRGTGECRFEPDRRLADALERRGIGRPNDGQLFYLAVKNVGTDLAQELERSGYPKPSLDQFVRAAVLGVSARYVVEMRELGHRPDTPQSLVEMSIHAVTPRYVRELAAAGITPDSGTLSTLALHRVTPDYVAEMRRLDPALSLERIARLRSHGLSTDYVKDIRSLGYGATGLGDLAQMRILGVTPDFVREANAQAGTRLEPRQLIHRKVMGRR